MRFQSSHDHHRLGVYKRFVRDIHVDVCLGHREWCLISEVVDFFRATKLVNSVFAVDFVEVAVDVVNTEMTVSFAEIAVEVENTEIVVSPVEVDIVLPKMHCSIQPGQMSSRCASSSSSAPCRVQLVPFVVETRHALL